MGALFTLLKTAPAQVDSLSVQQVLALCGNGKLTDGSECSQSFRQYLQVATSENLFNYVQTCLEESFDRSGFVLQDVVNECGRRLDYQIENGLYQGTHKAIGFDGLWIECGGYSLVVEVKTTDSYRINLDKIATYRDKLISENKISKDSSVLIVVGREDTGDLEAQVRGSKHAWNIRLISTDALAKLVALKENSESKVAAKIHELLVPFEYTKLDKIIEIAFTVAEDASSAAEQEQVPVEPATDEKLKQQHTSSEVIADIRARIVNALSVKYAPLVRNSRALYWSADKKSRAAITISKLYADGGYWYAYHSKWDEFLAAGEKGWYVLGCVGRNEAYAIPYDWIHSRCEHLSMTEREDDRHWHILLYPDASGDLSLHIGNGVNESLAPFKISPSKPIATGQSSTGQ